MNRNGDLSNDAPARALVHLDVFYKAPETPQERPRKLLGVFRALRPTPEVEEGEIDFPQLAKLWRWSDSRSVMLDVFSYDKTDDEVRKILDRIERRQSLPFHEAIGYADRENLVVTLPFRRDLIGVVDVPERGLQYGSWWISPEALL